MKNLFDKALHHLGKMDADVRAINIGAMDGVMFDEMIGYSNMYNYSVLYVEPIPYLFERLKGNVAGQFENSAICDYNGTVDMMIIDQAAIDSGAINKCFYGMSAVVPPKNGLGSVGDKDTVEKYGSIVKVPCITFEALIAKHNFHDMDIIKMDAEGHDYTIFKQIDLEKCSPSVIRLEWINLTEEEQALVVEKFDTANYIYEISGQDITGISPAMHSVLIEPEIVKTEEHNITLVTGIWDLGRENAGDGFKRPFSHYEHEFEKLLKATVDYNMVVYVEETTVELVKSIRSMDNTVINVKPASEFREFPFYKETNEIRKSEKWKATADWLEDSAQGSMELYNPMVMSKMFMLHDAKLNNSFDSTHFYWIDGGLTNTVSPGYFDNKALDALPKVTNKFLFIAFPYNNENDVHGFPIVPLNDIAGDKVMRVCRGGFFGGHVDTISKMNHEYYQVLAQTLGDGHMGTEETIFSILSYQHPDTVAVADVEENGLIHLFFENLKQNVVVVPTSQKNVALYVLAYNSPDQFEALMESFKHIDVDVALNIDKMYCLNNSTDPDVAADYALLFEDWGVEELKQDNIGICGGRQFIAEHAEANDFDAYIFFEDDMQVKGPNLPLCECGMGGHVGRWLTNALKIVEHEQLDFLKLSFTEYYGDNGQQWAWYNVPTHVRRELFPDQPIRKGNGVKDGPRTKFTNINCMDGLSYALGEIYYCNWPQIVTRAGNRKMFLDTTWAHPHEQTWMSYIYQKTVKGEIKSGVLMLSPIWHNRFDHYDGNDRKES